jgi:hypothetical protein
MKKALRLLFCALLGGLGMAGLAQAREFNQAELDALLAPVALYPDPVLSNVLDASQYPDEVKAAAAWTRDNPQLKGDEAIRALAPAPWHESVKALTAFPDVLARMNESPQWLRDLGDAYRTHGPYVMDTVQQLRRRAQANGNLQSNSQQRVYEDNGAVLVQPAVPQVVYVPYYDPFVVYGAWWWPAYRPVYFRPWPTYGVFVSFHSFPARVNWHSRQVVVVNHPVYVHPAPTHWRPGPPQAPRPQMQAPHRAQAPVRQMAPANWRASPRPQFTRATGHPQGGMHGGRRG